MLDAKDLDRLQKIAPFRSRRLFDEFLPAGYEMTTLDKVPEKSYVVGLKVVLGTIITFYDDFADRPDRLNSRLLQLLYRIPFESLNVHRSFLRAEEEDAFEFSRYLMRRLFDGIAQLRNHDVLIDLFRFDLKQFFLANHYCELLTREPSLANQLENRLYLHHNMGIIMAGMIDLMSLSHFDIQELGRARELFLLGQRAGRISNILTTFEREQSEGDVTNELMVGHFSNDIKFRKEFLESELTKTFSKMRRYDEISSFSSLSYAFGIEKLHGLHLKLKGVI